MTPVLLWVVIVLIVGWWSGFAFVAGQLWDDHDWRELSLSIFWPLIILIGIPLHWWRWGSKQHPRSRSVSLRWWERGQEIEW